MLGKRIINTGAEACTTDTTQILDAGKTQSLALYRFEDNANDTASSTGKFSKGAVFNGSSSYITTNLYLGSNWNSIPWSISFWAKADVAGDDYAFGTGNATGWAISFRSTGSVMLISGNNTAITYTVGQWKHFVYTFDGSSTTKGYGNGILENTQTSIPSHFASTNSITIGRYGTASSGYFDGQIDQIRFFNKELSSSEINTLYNETSSTVNTLQILGDTSCVAAYTFEGNANDLSTNYNGTASNVVYDYSGTASNITYVTGKFGKAASFNGTDASIDIESQSLIQSIKSFSFWFKHDFFFGFYDPSSASSSDRRRWFITNSTAGTIKIQVNNDQYNYQQTGITEDNNWHHLAVVDDGKIYLDGNLLSNTFSTSYWITNGTNGTSRDTIRMGSGDYIGSASTSFVQGLMDQIRFFDKTLTAPEINSLYNETATSAASATIDNPSTIAYYKMQDATDEAGSYDGTPTNVDFNVEGKYGFAGKFNGTSSYIDLPANLAPAIRSAAAFSVSLWFQRNGNQPNSYGGRLIHILNDIYININLETNNTVKALVVSSAPAYPETVTGVVPDNAWNHIVFTGDSNGIKLYLNGSLADSDNWDGTFMTYTNANYKFNRIGYSGSSVAYFKGKIDQVRIFNKAISAAEVTTLYNEVQCPNTIATPESYFNTKLYTGTGSTHPITGLGFKPGFIWTKNRDTTDSSALVDSVRGIVSPAPYLASNATTASATSTNMPTSVQDDGYTITGAGGRTNTNGENYVSWNWKAGETTESGTGNHYINVQKSVADEAGFSIVRFDFPFTPGGNAFVPTDASYNHGLSKKPDLIITKAYSGYLGGANWYTWASPLGAGTNGLQLDSNAAQGSGYFGTIDSTKAEFRFSSNNINGLSGVITYNFRNIDGYQRIGSYVGNANNTKIYTGFEPAWLLVKSLSSTNTWWIVDNKRDTANPRKQVLRPSSSSAETTETTNVIFHTNGFELPNGNSDTNENNFTYLFWAIAANPDTTAPTKANSFKTVIYTGDGGTSRQLTGMGFKPDFTWIKQRNAVDNHALFDSVRGVDLSLSSNLVNVTNDRTDDSTKGVTSFDADGVTLGSWNNVNGNNDTYVAWNWKALDHDRNLPTVNNDGSITSSVSANIAAGFSIVSYKGNATSGATVGHGLGGELDFLIVKSPNLTQAWNVYVKGVTDTNAKYLRLNEPNNIYTTVNPRFIPGNFNDNVFSVGSDNACNGNNDDYIAYCFRSISGYSKVGTYTGAGSSGKTITTGFQPRFILIKRIDDSNNNSSWGIYDSERGGTKTLRSNTSGAETSASTTEISFTSTGISIPASSTSGLINESGDTYIYLAIA